MYKITSIVNQTLTYDYPKICLDNCCCFIKLKGVKRFKGAVTNYPTLKIKGNKTYYEISEPKDNGYLEILSSSPGCEVKCSIIYYEIIQDD